MKEQNGGATERRRNSNIDRQTDKEKEKETVATLILNL